MRDGVGGTCFHAVTAEDAPVVVDVVNSCIPLSAAESLLFSVFGRFDINAISWAGCGAKEAGHAFLEAIFVALQDVSAAKALLQLCWPVRIFFRNRWLQHLLEGDAHALGDRSC